MQQAASNDCLKPTHQEAAAQYYQLNIAKQSQVFAEELVSRARRRLVYTQHWLLCLFVAHVYTDQLFKYWSANRSWLKTLFAVFCMLWKFKQALIHHCTRPPDSVTVSSIDSQQTHQSTHISSCRLLWFARLMRHCILVCQQVSPCKML